MPFGLTNAPTIFQVMINHVLPEYLDIFVVVYLGDILIFSDTLEQHHAHVEQVLEMLQEARLLVEAEKCRFHTQQVDSLGYTTRPGEIRMQESKIEAVWGWHTPTSVKGLREFLGFTNFYRRFICNHSKIAAPFTDITKKDMAFSWNEAAQKAF